MSDERRAAVDRAREGWIRRLIDLSRRNNLLYYRDLKAGTLDLSNCQPAALAAVLAGEPVPLNRLLPESDETQTAARAQEIRRRALANLEEKGLETLFLALGLATWTPSDEGRPPQAPVILVPVAVEARGREGRALALRRSGDVQVNLVLLHVLDVEHGRLVTPESLLETGPGDDEDAPFEPAVVFARLSGAGAGITGFVVAERAVLGNFSFQKMAMVKDLQERGAELAAHDLIAAIAGDGSARDAVGAQRGSIDPNSFDQIPPGNEFLILDADASQQRVVASVLASHDGVIHGPPGTGKSQTIANLIAALAAEGRRVLFVAEKRAALEVVLRRLDQIGLGHLALDLHGADVSRRAVMQQVAQSLALVRDALPVNPGDLHQRFTDRRARLNAHVTRLHAPRRPSGTSAYELQGRLLRLPVEGRAATRWRGAELDPLDRASAEIVKDLLVEAGGFGGLFLRDHPSPWTGADLPDGASVERAIALAARLASERCPGTSAALAAMTAATGLTAPRTLHEATGQVSLLSDVADTLRGYSEAIFRESLEALALALAPAEGGGLATVWACCSNRTFRQARKTVRGLRRAGRAPATQYLAEVRSAADRLRRWRVQSSEGSMPRAYAELEILRDCLESLITDVEVLSRYLGRSDLERLPLDTVDRLFEALASDIGTPPRLPRLCEIERALRQHGVAAIVRELRARKPDPSRWPVMFESAWLASCLDRARAEDSGLAGFHGRTHDQFVAEFRRLDRERLALAAARVRRAHAERVIAAMNAYPEQAALVRREAAKMTRHLPFRRLVAGAPDVLTGLRPCWMASPLSVSQLLPADRRHFDVVIFDEASQVLPEDGVPALLRGARAVVAGDRHQLPPTPFFVVGEDEDETDEPPGPTEGFESLLDLMSSFLDPWSLEWHYRSRDEALIAFSNRHIYRDSLITFPGPGGPPTISHVLVPHPSGRDGQEGSPSSEVERVVELVLQHAMERPRETLGVIALGITHARRVEAAIEHALKIRSDLDEFFDQGGVERFFVKNLERVQGDERDAIILTVGAGKDRAGRLDYRQFGPLNQKGSERRLNVAITRARRRMTLVSSFDHTDMTAGGARERGVELLRLYLEYSASHGARLGDTGPTDVPLNPFELDVYDSLSMKGLTLISQWGASHYRIDMVVRHPARPGRFVLAVECDGANYHAAHTARDRDRLRQQHLEALGWRFHRIWSTDWFMRPEEEISRALTAFEAAVAHADRVDSSDRGGTGGAADRPSDAGGSVPAGPSRPHRDRSDTGRGARPQVARRQRIEDYTLMELMNLVQWIQSDRRLRTDEEVVEEMVDELGFQRRGKNIEAEVRRAIERVRSMGSKP